MRGMSIPLEVLTISSKEEGSGEVVPIPTAPVEGNVLVCPIPERSKIKNETIRVENCLERQYFVFIMLSFDGLLKELGFYKYKTSI